MVDVLIIGGGIIGMLTARELSLAGASVCILEKGDTARESSWAGGGILSPLYPWRYDDAITRLARYSQQAYPALTVELFEATGIDPEYEPSGLLILEQEELESGLAWAGRWGLTAEKVDHARARELEPELKPSTPHALWMPEIAQVRNPRLARALRADIERRGVQILTHTPVTGIRFENNRAQGVETPTGLIEGGQLIACAGAWTAELLDGSGHRPDIEPVRGQMVLCHATPGLVRHITLCQDHYAIPRRDGRVLFGSTLEHQGFDKSTTSQAREELYTLAIELLPALRRFPIERHWAGLRPGSPGGVPYIGRHPQAGNLFVNAGHFRNGVVLGPASARLAADILLDRPPILDPAPYAMQAMREIKPGNIHPRLNQLFNDRRRRSRRTDGAYYFGSLPIKCTVFHH